MITKQSGKKRSAALTARLNIAALACFFFLIIWGIFLVRNKLLYNAHDMGTRLAESYAEEEDIRLSIYQMLLSLGSANINELMADGRSLEELQNWLANYSKHLTEILGDPVFDPYAVIDGRIIAAQPWEGDSSFDYTSAAWYQEALAARGNPICTDTYTDSITGGQVVTLAQELDTPNNVLAFHILMDNFHFSAHTDNSEASQLPRGGSYYLFDSNGNMLYAKTDLNLDSPNGDNYLQRLYQTVSQGNMQEYSSTIRDLNGRNRGVYYSSTQNGWYSIITIPVDQILFDEYNTTLVILVLICLVLAGIVVAIIIRNYISDRKIRHVADTLTILGNTYYAIYRINYEEGTYESVKSSEDVKDLLGAQGAYRHLIDVVKGYVDEKTYEEFEQSFSVENIRRLISQGIYEFGGDYQRSFSGVPKWVSIKIIYTTSLSLNEVIMCFREIDAEKHREMQRQILLENALNSARQTAERKNAFFSNVSHDMRTPLNAIIGLADLAGGEEHLPPRAADYLKKIQSSGSQLLTLVNDILDMSRIEHGEKTALDYAPMDLRKCISDCLALFGEQARQQQKTLEFQDDGARYGVICDSFRLSQILNNLISNALKYSNSGARITVTLSLAEIRQKTGKYQIEVADTGIGMSEEFLEHIFEPFARETMFAPSSVTGTGLGMPIVKSIVQQMSGEISVRSTLGQGTAVTVILPLQIAEATELDLHTSPETQENSQFMLTGKKILVAEDNMINMEIATEYLKMQGAEVIQAWNGKEAVEIFSSLAEGSLDAILMDMQMPEMDGCTASRAIRSMDRRDARSIPIIAVTANAFAEDIARTREAGMNAHISKPLDIGALMDVLKEHIRPGASSLKIQQRRP